VVVKKPQTDRTEPVEGLLFASCRPFKEKVQGFDMLSPNGMI
jgi:hypothetical protein